MFLWGGEHHFLIKLLNYFFFSLSFLSVPNLGSLSWNRIRRQGQNSLSNWKPLPPPSPFQLRLQGENTLLEAACHVHLGVKSPTKLSGSSGSSAFMCHWPHSHAQSPHTIHNIDISDRMPHAQWCLLPRDIPLDKDKIVGGDRIEREIQAWKEDISRS